MLLFLAMFVLLSGHNLCASATKGSATTAAAAAGSATTAVQVPVKEAPTMVGGLQHDKIDVTHSSDVVKISSDGTTVAQNCGSKVRIYKLINGTWESTEPILEIAGPYLLDNTRCIDSTDGNVYVFDNKDARWVKDTFFAIISPYNAISQDGTKWLRYNVEYRGAVFNYTFTLADRQNSEYVKKKDFQIKSDISSRCEISNDGTVIIMEDGVVSLPISGNPVVQKLPETHWEQLSNNSQYIWGCKHREHQPHSWKLWARGRDNVWSKVKDFPFDAPSRMVCNDDASIITTLRQDPEAKDSYVLEFYEKLAGKDEWMWQNRACRIDLSEKLNAHRLVTSSNNTLAFSSGNTLHILSALAANNQRLGEQATTAASADKGLKKAATIGVVLADAKSSLLDKKK